MSYPDNVRVFWCEIVPQGLCSVSLRSADESVQCPNGVPGLLYHHTNVMLPTEMLRDGWDKLGWDESYRQALESKPKCSCGFEFTLENSKSWGRGFHQKFRRVDTGEIFNFNDLPVGAMWDAEYHHDIPEWCGPDGLSVHVKCPDGCIWGVDSRANNCTMKDDKVHKCWVRHGDPRKGEIHVDKNGFTCQAGAGSIQTPRWHGFLHNNVLSTQG
jgi:hypothetical protein